MFSFVEVLKHKIGRMKKETVRKYEFCKNFNLCQNMTSYKLYLQGIGLIPFCTTTKTIMSCLFVDSIYNSAEW